MYKRILLKLSGEALSNDTDFFDRDVLDNIASQVKTIVDSGVEVAIVVGGGNFIRGRMSEDLGIDRIQVDYMGMLGTVINALAIQGALERHDVEVRVQTAIDMNEVAEPFIPRRAIRHMEKGRVVVFGGGTGSAFFSTDTTAALRASEIKADVILMAKNGVDGVYNADPRIDSNAVKYDNIDYMTLLQEELEVMDSTATSMCMENNIDLLVFNMNENGNIVKAALGTADGTRISKGGN